MQQLPLGVRIRDRAIFGTYLPARNAQAVDHLALVAGGHRVETTWICGPHGTGKTHLLQAVCVQASETVQAAYYPMRELASLGTGVLEDLPQLDCLCIDDVDAITGKREWERALDYWRSLLPVPLPGPVPPCGSRTSGQVRRPAWPQRACRSR